MRYRCKKIHQDVIVTDLLCCFTQPLTSDKSEDAIIRRTLEDLRMYEQFFPEVLDIEVGTYLLLFVKHLNY